jgi:diaminobutyrate-2-oxoglutarate transaminase
MTLGALACTGNGLHRGVAGVSLDHVTRVPYDGYLGDGVDTLEGLRRQLADPSSGVVPPAAFIVEVIQAEGGVNVATAEWLRAVQEMAREHDSLFIIDDIQVGMGRTGTFFSFEKMGLDPDIVVLAKGLGGYGTPIAMVMIKPERDKWGPGEHTGTFRGPGLSFIAGAEALSFFEDDALMKDVVSKGARTDERLAAMAKKHGAIKAVRSAGMIHGVECTSGAAANKAINAAFEAGAIFSTCGPGGRVIKLIAPLTIEDDVLDKGLDILDKSLAKAS